VHLLRGPDGLPVFEGDLSVLNIVATTDRIGAGTVVRHEVAREECNDDYLQKRGFPLRGELKRENNYSGLYGFNEGLLQKLASLTKPNVQWWLLYLLTIGYLVVIGPVHYRWSRKVDYRVAIGGFLGTVAAFSVAFIFAGSRGAGEIQTAHTVAVAQSLGETRWDVMQWSSAFATTGDRYRLTHLAPTNLYSAPSEVESVNGFVVNGKGGFFDVDIPLYSARPFVHRGVMTGPSAGLQVLQWKPELLELQTGEGFPDDVLECVVRRGDYILPMRRDGGKWVWNQKISSATDVESYFDQTTLQQFSYESRANFKPKTAFVPLLATFFGDVKGLQKRISRRPLPAGQAQLFVYAKAPDSFAMQGKGFHSEEGWDLYVIDIFRPNP